MSDTLKDENKTTTESGVDLIELNGQMVNEILSKREAKESFNLMAHLANGAGARDLPRLVDKTDLNEDDKFIVAALVVSANAFCYDIVARKEAESIGDTCLRQGSGGIHRNNNRQLKCLPLTAYSNSGHGGATALSFMPATATCTTVS